MASIVFSAKWIVVGVIAFTLGSTLSRTSVQSACAERHSHETRRLPDGHVDGVTVASRRVDAIDAKFNFGSC